MRFEAKELKPYAVPVQTDQLKAGEIYFSVQFVDEEMLIPIMEPLIYLGKNLKNREGELLYFQSVESYARGIRIQSAGEDERSLFQIANPELINHIFEFERGLDVLLSCALKRQALHK